MKRVWVVSAKRTPQGRFLGGLSKFSPVDLAVAASKAALSGINPERVDSVIVGNVLGAGFGMNIARQIAIHSGLSISTPAYTVNMMCASGMQAVILAAQSIQSGNARMVLCGGTESMSQAPHLLKRARGGVKMGNGEITDLILSDGLIDSFNQEHMGLTAERLAEQYGITRNDQDQFASESQQKYASALQAGNYQDEITPLGQLTNDEPPRPETTVETLASLKPAFRPTGTVTAGNASGLNDGAAMLVVCEEEFGKQQGLTPMMILSSSTSVGCSPEIMGLGPVYATRRLSNNISEFDMIELNEAFAAQSLACIQELGFDKSLVNQDGGAIALGHPLGASGARLLVHMSHRKPDKGLATLCVGGGMGCAVVLEKP
ncbi:thiolase family protein [Planctomicrobium sp. SH527]|uniref:thiolase family protein n=1 Tax=Planctomicrobium sp. SH527 TaxID=3448123 RepID=UPI003F5AE8A1